MAKIGFISTYVTSLVISMAAAVAFDWIVERIVQRPLKKLLKI